MASIYTANQREQLEKASVYDYMYQKLSPPCEYGRQFFVHIGTRRGEVTGPRDPGAICIHPEKGYTNFSTDYRAQNGWGGVQVAYALMDYYNTLGYGHYNFQDTHDFAEIVREISADLGISQDKNSKAKINTQKHLYVKPKNLLDRYADAIASAIEKETRAEVPPKATIGSNGYAPDSTIIKYMAERGIDPKITKDLIATGLVYLTETQPYYEVEKDATGNFLKDEKGRVRYKLDKNGQKIPQTYIDKNGITRPKMQYNIVFASKDQSKENAFYERKPVAKRGQAYIAPNSSAFGYFSFTGGLTDFKQIDIPEKTNKPMKAYICEAPIDAISLYALHQKTGVVEPAEYIAISGCGKDMTIQRAICEGYDCVLAFDNDDKGLKAMDARRMNAFIDPITNQEVSLPAIVPPKIQFDYSKFKDAPMQHVESKDWNDVLLALEKGQNCSQDPKEAMKKDLASTPRLRGNPKVTEGFRKKPCPQIEPRRFPKPFEPAKAEEKEKQVTKEKEEALVH